MQHAGFQLSHLLKKRIVSRVRTLTYICFTKRYLIYTNMGISLCLSGLGDVLEQQYEIFTKEQEKWDGERCKRMSISGLGTGFVMHCTYGFLDRFFPGNALRTVAKKMIIDQCLFSPLTIGIQLTLLAILENFDYEIWKKEIIYKGWQLYIAEYVVWPPAQFINFYFLPPRFRVLYDNTISLGYDVYTSQVKHADHPEVPKKEKKEATNKPM